MILFRYLFREVAQATFAVTVVLLLIVMSGRLAKYLTQASSGDLAADVVFWVILYRVPDFLPLILPLGLFIGVLMAYGRLYVESEMVVMSACGTSKLQLLVITLVPGVLVAMFVAGLSLWGAPAGLSKVQSILKDPANRQGLAILQEGKFQPSQDGKRVTYAEELSGKRDHIRGVWLVEHGQDGVLTIIRAEEGEIEQAGNGTDTYFRLNRGVAYEGVVGQRDYQVTEFETFGQKLDKTGDSEKQKLKVDAKPTAELLQSADAEDLAALHWRLSLPVVVIVVTLMSLALSKTNHRQGRYTKMLPAIFVYLAYIVTITGMRDLVATKGTPVVFFWLVHAVFFGIALLALYLDEIGHFLDARRSRKAALR